MCQQTLHSLLRKVSVSCCLSQPALAVLCLLWVLHSANLPLAPCLCPSLSACPTLPTGGFSQLLLPWKQLLLPHTLFLENPALAEQQQVPAAWQCSSALAPSTPAEDMGLCSPEGQSGTLSCWRVWGIPPCNGGMQSPAAWSVPCTWAGRGRVARGHPCPVSLQLSCSPKRGQCCGPQQWPSTWRETMRTQVNCIFSASPSIGEGSSHRQIPPRCFCASASLLFSWLLLPLPARFLLRLPCSHMRTSRACRASV